MVRGLNSMRIVKASVEHFGKIKECQLEFSKGLNVIYGENESGKSTLLAFIKTMLYGFTSNKKNIRDNDRKRYIPWGEANACGELYLGDGPSTYRVKRHFGEKKSQDRLELMNAVSGENIQLEASNSPGKQLFGIDVYTYEKTSLIAQLSCQISQNNSDEMMKYLTNLKETGDASVSYHQAKKNLEDYKKSLVNTIKKPGVLDELRRDYDVRQEKLVQLRNKKEAFHEQVLSDCVNFDKEIEVLFSYSEENQHDHIASVKDKLVQYLNILDQQEHRKCENEKEAFQLPEEDVSELLSMDVDQAREDLNRIIEESVRVESYHEVIKKHQTIKEGLNQLREDGKRQELAQEIKKLEYAAEELEGLLKRQQDYNHRLNHAFNNSKLRKAIVTRSLMIGTAFVCLLLMAGAIIMDEIPAPAGAVLILPFYYLLSKSFKIMRKSQEANTQKQEAQYEIMRLEKRIKNHFAKYGVRNYIQLHEKIQKMKMEYGKMDTVIQEKEKLLIQYDKEQSIHLIEKSEALVSQLLRKYKCDRREELNNKILKQQEVKAGISKLNEMKQFYKKEERARQLKKQSLYQELIEAIRMLYEQVLFSLKLGIDCQKEKVLAYENEVKAVDEALNAMESSFLKFHMSFSRQLNEKSRNILASITKNKYNQVLISKDLDIKISHDDSSEVRSIDYFSNGTWDQIYFSVRMAITEIISERIGKKLPLLLDDAFVQYDESRMGAVLEYLYDYSKNHQVILFTCQQREVDYLRKYKDVNVINGF